MKDRGFLPKGPFGIKDFNSDRRFRDLFFQRILGIALNFVFMNWPMFRPSADFDFD